MTIDPWDHLRERMNALGLFERDLDEQFVRSTGHGGQNVNKVSSCVILIHRPTGIRIRCEEDRSQARNRFLARARLADRWQALKEERVRAERFAAEKKRRQKRKRSKNAKERQLQNKHHRSDIKKNRRRIHQDDL